MHPAALAAAQRRGLSPRAQQILLRVGFGALVLLALMVLSALNASQARADDAAGDQGGLVSSVLDLPADVLDTVDDAVVGPAAEKVVRPIAETVVEKVVVDRIVKPVVREVVAPVVQGVVRPVVDAVVPVVPVEVVVPSAETEATGQATVNLDATPSSAAAELASAPRTTAPEATATTPDTVRSPEPAPAAPGTPAASSVVSSGASGGATGAADTERFAVAGAAASAALLFESGTSPPASPTYDHDTSPD